MDERPDSSQQLMDILLVMDEKGTLQAVSGVKDGELQTKNPLEDNNDLLRVDRHGDMFSNFFSNLWNQLKDPTRFHFFRVPEEEVQRVAADFRQRESQSVKTGEPLVAQYEVQPPVQAQQQTQAGQQQQPEGAPQQSAGQGIYSLGRVQTPTLMMICSRYLENRDFTPQTYFRLKVTAEKDGTPFAAISELRYETLPAANAALAAVTATGTVQVSDVQRKEVSQEPPLLYDLTALQKEANGRYGFSADKTLSVAQSLYEKKVLSYPRTGSRYLSEDVFDEIPDRIALLERYPAFAAHAAALKGASLNHRSVDAGKVTDHHALIITECLPGKLSADERTVYDMVAARLLEAFSARCLKDVTTVSLTAGNSVFTAKGTVVRSAGWRAVRNERDEDDEGTAALPPLQPGEAFLLQSAECVEKQTKPRPLHTESSLLSAMEHCGRELRDDELRDSLKGNGIGTPATRASIIETLFARDYVRREKKSLVPTDKGLAVYQIVKDKRIADVEMTGQWETALAKIESGEMNPDTFRKGIEVYAAQITEELLQV